MFGYSPDEAIGQNVKSLIPAHRHEEFDECLSRCLKSGPSRTIGADFESVGQRKDGSTFPVELSASTLHDGIHELVTCIIRDISERKAQQRELVTIVSDRQRHIGQDLHDNVGQKLTGLGMLAGSLEETLKEHSPADAEAAHRIAMGVEGVLERIRNLSKGLLPVDVDAAGLRTALAELAEATTHDSGVRCHFDCDQPIRVEDNETATHLYRIAQEALTNALKHAASRKVTISLAENKNQIVLSVRDNGKGFLSRARQGQGMGLKTMQYRASLIGAILSITPVKNGGTLVTCRLLEPEHHGKTPARRK